jgi:hypothetical protein
MTTNSDNIQMGFLRFSGDSGGPQPFICAHEFPAMFFAVFTE